MVAMTDTFDVPQAVQNAAKRGLEMRRKYGRGGLDAQQANKEGVGSGVQRASDLMSGKVSYRTVKRMAAFFSRHRANKDSRMPNGEPGAGMIVWLIWGGNAGDRWSRSVISREEGIKKGSLAALLLFGEYDDDAIDPEPVDAIDPEPILLSTPEVKKALSFTELLRASKPVPTIEIDEDMLVVVAEDYDYSGEVMPLAPPAGAIAPELPALSDAQLEALVNAETDEEAAQIVGEMQKAVVEIDLMQDYVQQEEKDPDAETDPAPEVPPEPQLQVVVSEEEHRAMKKIVKGVLNIPLVERGAAQIGKHIMRGDWAKIDMELVCSYLMDVENKFNAAAVGGSAMLKAIEKAAPKVPEKYLEGLSGRERAKRQKFIQNRVRGKHTGDPYKDMPADKDAKTKPSSYARTNFAAKVREEMTGSSKSDFLSAAAKVSGISRAILDKVYRRGAEAWATGGHRPGASQEAWARARVYSFATGGKTRSTADKDLWQDHLDNKKD